MTLTNVTEDLKRVYAEAWEQVATEDVRWDLYLQAFPTGQLGPEGEMQAATTLIIYGEIAGHPDLDPPMPITGTWIAPQLVGQQNPEVALAHVRDMFSALVKIREIQPEQVNRDREANRGNAPGGLIRPGDPEFVNLPDNALDTIRDFTHLK